MQKKKYREGEAGGSHRTSSWPALAGKQLTNRRKWKRAEQSSTNHRSCTCPPPGIYSKGSSGRKPAWLLNTAATSSTPNPSSAPSSFKWCLYPHRALTHMLDVSTQACRKTPHRHWLMIPASATMLGRGHSIHAPGMNGTLKRKGRHNLHPERLITDILSNSQKFFRS